MKINSNEELLEVIGEGFLWNIVSEYIAHDIEHIKEALRQLGYIDQADVDKLTFAEDRDSDEFNIISFSENGHTLTAEYEMPTGILTCNEDKSVCFHMTACCTGTIEVPDYSSYDWGALDFENMNRPQILSYSHLAKLKSLSYEYVEADDLNA
ncbi:hypothetical protein [Ruminococcus sp.]|uniref:hypothetical protein n=1 Tax=Ruminococcus sp. TaxID=41978 RepID=UPI0025F538A7|nr:hypothetical protein [Ruminococcus sp.]MBQ8968010.1 hypothetical protein [Ruminococcus sp.]